MARRFLGQEEWNEDEYPVDISTEESEVMVDEANELAGEITAETADANRMMDVADSLEDMAVVADDIVEATPAETHLVQIAGDMAAAGADDMTGEDIVQAQEGVGRRIAVEGFKETARNIWEALKKWLKDIWSKVEKFFYKIFGDVPRLRKNIEALRKRQDQVGDKGQSVDRDNKTFELTSGVRQIMVGTNPSKTWTAVHGGFAESMKVIDHVLSIKDLKKFGEEIEKGLHDFDVGSEQAARDSLDTLTSEGAMRGVTMAVGKGVLPHTVNTTANSRFGDQVVYSSPDLLGGDRLIKRHRPFDKDKGNSLAVAELQRTLRLEYTHVTDKTPKVADSVKFETMSMGDIDKALDDAEKMLDILEKFNRGSAKKELFKTKDAIIKASDKLESQMSKLDDEDGRKALPFARAAYKLNATFVNVATTSTMQSYRLGLTNVRTVLMLVSRSLSQYKTKND